MNAAQTFAFGSFRLIPERQLLLHRGTEVRIGCRALDLLTALVERAGELMTKKELMARVWPTTIVEECNLKVNISALRRALDADAAGAAYIATVTGRGYRFIAPVGRDVLPAPKWPRALASRPSTSPPRGQEARIRLVDLPPNDDTLANESMFESVDYGIVIDGEMTFRIEGATVLLKPGSLVPRRGVCNAWANLSGKPCRMLFVELVSND
jgi:DNA-binding winged helix-turn-helix (wHTH) protein